MVEEDASGGEQDQRQEGYGREIAMPLAAKAIEVSLGNPSLPTRLSIRHQENPSSSVHARPRHQDSAKRVAAYCPPWRGGVVKTTRRLCTAQRRPSRSRLHNCA